MNSDDCAVRVEHALLSVAGVENAIVDFDESYAVIRVNEVVSDYELAEAVDAEGYTLVMAATSDPDEEREPEPEPDEPAPPEPPPPEPPPPPAPEPQGIDSFDPSSEPQSTWQLVWLIASRTALYGFVGSILLTVAYRFVPVPTTMLMLSEAVIEGRTIRNNWVSLKRISPHLIRAVIASEDNEFCHHWGFDFQELEDAWKESKNGGRLRGASTISQQTAKNVFLWSDRSWLRKGFEAYFTLLIEGLWPKRRYGGSCLYRSTRPVRHGR